MAAESIAVASAGAIRCSAVQRVVWLDYWALTKPDVNFLIAITTAAAFCMARPRVFASLPLAHLLHTLAGTLLVASGAATLNQWMERPSTRGCAGPLGDRSPPAASNRRTRWSFGVLLSLAGIGQLLLAVGPVPSLLALATLAELPVPLHAPQADHAAVHADRRRSRARCPR